MERTDNQNATVLGALNGLKGFTLPVHSTASDHHSSAKPLRTKSDSLRNLDAALSRSVWSSLHSQPTRVESAVHKHTLSAEPQSSVQRRVRVWKADDPMWTHVPSQHQPAPEKKKWTPKATIRSHVDAIRDLAFLPGALASASEDCMIKLWDLSRLASANIEPCLTLRGHVGPVLSLASGHAQDLYSAGVDGTIRHWRIPTPKHSSPYLANRNYCQFTCSAHKDAVWALAHHPLQQRLLSLSADGTIKLWDGPKLLREFYQTTDVQTVCTWLKADPEYFVVGHAQSVSFCHVASDERSIVNFGKDPWQQVNCVAAFKDKPVVVTGHEDKCVRVFDMRSCTTAFVAHADSVTTLDLDESELHLVTGGQDGNLRNWDLRKWECVQDLPAHRRKYDEAVNVVKCHPVKQLLASGGADSLIKVFGAR